MNIYTRILTNTLIYKRDFLIKVEAEHIALFEMKIVQIIGQLLLSPLMIRIAPPHLHLDHKLLPPVIDDQVRPR